MFVFEDPLGGLRQRGVVVSEEDFDLQKPLRKLKSFCKELAIIRVDPTVAMQRISAQNAFLPKDDHLSVAGHRILAERLVRHFDNRHQRFTNCPECPDE